MRMSPTQRLLVQLSRDTTDDQLELLMDLTGAGAGVKGDHIADTIGYLVYLRGKHRTLRDFLDSLIAALKDSELQSLYHIIEQHDADCREDDMAMKPEERCCPSSDQKQSLDFAIAMQKINKHILKKDLNIMKTISPINESEKEGVSRFSILGSKLKDCGCISEDNVEFLRDIFEELNLVQPLAILVEYENNIQTPPTNPNFLSKPRHSLYRQEQVRERPSPSLGSGQNYKSHSAPESTLLGHTPNASSAQGDPQPQTRVLYKKNLSVPHSGRLASVGNEYHIPHDPIYPSGMGGYHSPPFPGITATSSNGAAEVPPLSRGTEVVPSAPPKDHTIVSQAPPPVADSQVIVNHHHVGIHGSSHPSPLRGPVDNQIGSSGNPDAFHANVEQPSSLSTYHSDHSFPSGQPTESTQRRNIGQCSSIPSGCCPEEHISHIEDLSSASSSHQLNEDRFATCKSRQTTGPSGVAYPSLPHYGGQVSQPPVTQTSPRPGEGVAHSQAPGLHPNIGMNENHGGRFHSHYLSSLRSSAVAGIASRSLGASTLSESGNVVGHPSNSSGETAGIVAPNNRLYPSLQGRTSGEGPNTMGRKRSPPNIHREEKRIKVEDCTESEEDFSTPPQSPGGPTSR